MPRPSLVAAQSGFALASLILISPLLLAADPPPVEKHLLLQKAMVTARQSLDDSKPAEAVATLEAEIANADGNKAFLTLLREAYQAELTRLDKSATPDAARIAQLRRNLTLIGGTVPATPPAPPSAPPTPAPALPPPTDLATPPSADTLPEADIAFKKGNYEEAQKLYAANGAKLTPQQKAAWAYCRVKLANDKVNAQGCDSATAAACAADVAEALKLAPQHAELQKIGQQVLATAEQKANGRPFTPPVLRTAGPNEPAGVTFTGDVIETASFRVRYTGNRELAEAVAKEAEAQRKIIFERWSGPTAGAWTAKCEIIIHPSADAYAKATGRPVGTTGRAVVRLTNGQAQERRIDLRADDDLLTANALPRELTHVILADLFPDKPAPKWAVEGMAILAGSPEEASRYTRTLPRCVRDGEWFSLAQLMELKDFPSDKITAFYCESVSLTEYLVRAGGNERNFTIFLRDCQRYGTAQAIKRQYGLDGLQALEAAWKRTVAP